MVSIFSICKTIGDSIVHYDYFKKKGWGKFWWKETVEQVKTTKFHKYFPMFYDAWHLTEAITVLQISIMAIVFLPAPPYIIVLLSIGYYIYSSWLFLFLYERTEK